MTTTKTLLLAGLAVVSLGVGAANAQSLTPSSTEGAYYVAQNRAAANSPAANANKAVATAPQFGSSDVERRTAPIHFDSNLTEGGL